MELSRSELQIINALDDGSLYADVEVVREQFRYPGMLFPRLLISRDPLGFPTGYLPVGQFYDDGTIGYIAAMPNSPAISPTYPPGAVNVLLAMQQPYLDTDVVAELPGCRLEPTASAYGLPLDTYLAHLSPARRKDARRKLKQFSRYDIRPGTLDDIRHAWQWMQAVWDGRGDDFGSTPYADYLEMTLSWLGVMQRSARATLKLDVYRIDGRPVGVNCCVLHRYRQSWHCDDYLTWFDPQQAGGLGILSAIRNLTDPNLRGMRYNLGNPGVGNVHPRHAYKYALLPAPLRLAQCVAAIHC